jgi:glycosyltransferase involved in cell wall biosynthesis
MTISRDAAVVSIVVPCYDEADTVRLFFSELSDIVSQIPEYGFEFIFVDDGSRDQTLNIVKELVAADPRVRYLSFSRNFGKEAALLAGLRAATGNLVAVMDADMQDPPRLLPKMIEIITASSPSIDRVATRRVSREGEPPIRSFFARLFYKLIARLSETKIVDGARDFCLMTRRYVDSILLLSEYNRFSKGLFSWVGYTTEYLEYENRERAAGNSKFSFFKLLSYAIDGLVNFSSKPLRLASVIGVLSFFAAIVAIVFLVIRKLMFGDPVSGWASSICVILLLGGLQLLCIGILGEYLARIYLETKGRPIYICQESNIEQFDKPYRRPGVRSDTTRED